MSTLPKNRKGENTPKIFCKSRKNMIPNDDISRPVSLMGLETKILNNILKLDLAIHRKDNRS